ncbi:TPA: ATP-binding protein, partial [Bacillus thuringiensis]|nr:ATP-binding protein [Bacillus thuringiensis]
IVKKVLDLHQGEIKVESEEGKGTEFIVRMPNHEEK